LTASVPCSPAQTGRAAPAQPLPSLLEEIAQTHGFDGAVYMHFGHGLRGALGPDGRPRPQRVAATRRFDVEQYLNRNYLALDPLAAAAGERYAPFSWRLADLAGSNAAGARFLGVMAAWGMTAGVVAPVQDYARGPALLNLFGGEGSLAGPLDLGMVMLAAVRVHQAAMGLGQAQGEGESSLSPREMAVLRLAAIGRTEQETAVELGLSRRGVQFHLARVLEKLGATNKTAAVARAVGAGLIRTAPDEPA
jgi:DNA-binding CsgD family transcriptional regulator